MSSQRGDDATGRGRGADDGESIREAVAFRQMMMARLHHEFAQKGDWFFDAWQPDEVTDPATGRMVLFQEAPAEHLSTAPAAVVLQPGAAWHGFAELDDGYCMLDPIKVSVVTPGMGRDAVLEPTGVSGDAGHGLSRPARVSWSRKPPTSRSSFSSRWA